jgi:hypothetical protein
MAVCEPDTWVIVLEGNGQEPRGREHSNITTRWVGEVQLGRIRVGRHRFLA